jgi:hypothetical protein
MLITLLALLALAFLARSLMLRYGSKVGFANAAAGAIVVAFLTGFICHALYFSAPQTAVVPMVAPPTPLASPTLPGSAVAPVDRHLSEAQMNALRPAGNAIPYSVVESFGGSGPNGDQITAGATVFVHGWAGDPATKATAAGLLFIVDGTRRFDATSGYGGDRLDVATAFKTMAMLHTNVGARLPTAGLSKGLHHLELAAIRRDGRHYRIITVPAKPFTLQ